MQKPAIDDLFDKFDTNHDGVIDEVRGLQSDLSQHKEKTKREASMFNQQVSQKANIVDLEAMQRDTD